MHIIDGENKGGEEITLPTVEADIPQEIEIEIGADGSGTVIETTDKKPEGQGDGGEPAPKRKGRFQRRMDQLTARTSQLEETNQRLMAELEERRKSDAEKDRRIEQLDSAAFKNHAAHVRAQVEKAQKDLADAHAAGDAERVSKATIDAGKWAAELGRVEAWERTHPAPTGDQGGGSGDPEPTRTTTSTQQPQQPQMDPLMRSWVAENPWFMPGTKDNPNPDFDMEMHKFAVNHGAVLEARYRRAGKPIDQKYWDELTAAIDKEFPEEEGNPNPNPQPRRGQAPAMKNDGGNEIPITSRSAPTAQPAAKPGKVTLDKEEIALVQSNVDNGVYGINPKTGKPYTYQEGYVRFALAKQKDLEQQAQLQGQRRA